jgi:hypothetical protein
VRLLQLHLALALAARKLSPLQRALTVLRSPIEVLADLEVSRMCSGLQLDVPHKRLYYHITLFGL